MRKTLSSRLFAAVSLLIVFSISLLGILFTFFAGRYLRSERIEGLRLCAGTARDAFRESISGGRDTEQGRDDLKEEMRLVTAGTSSVLLLADSDGRVIICTEEDGCPHTGLVVPGRALRAIDDSGSEVRLEDVYPGIFRGYKYSVGRAARTGSGELAGYVFALSESAGVSDFMDTLLAIFLISALVILIVSGWVTVVVTEKITDPLRAINDAARRFARGDFSVRLAVEGDEEIARMARTFNRMADFVERNEKSRSSFIANVAHELRTPMTSIKGFVDGIRDGTIPPESQDKYLAVVSDEIGRLARLTNNMLDMSKLESGEFQMNPAEYNIWDTIAAVVLSLENRVEDRNITLRGFIPGKVTVFADEDIVHQVVYNLFDNALKFTPEGGYIEIKVEKVSTAFVQVKIKNSGEGIRREDLPYVFERFYKADESRSVHTRGAGIGLFIARTLVQRSGGNIYVDSREGEYTEFCFTLPREGVPEPTRRKKPRRGRQKAKGDNRVKKEK